MCNLEFVFGRPTQEIGNVRLKIHFSSCLRLEMNVEFRGGIFPEDVMNVLRGPLCDLGGVLHRQKLLVDGQDRSTIAMRKFQIQPVDVDVLPRTAKGRVLTVKIRRIHSIGTIENPFGILSREKGDHRTNVRDGGEVVPDIGHVT